MAGSVWDEPTRRVAPVGAGRRRVAVAGKAALGMVAALVLAATGYGWTTLNGLTNGLVTSNALDGEAGSLGGDTNILIMGLDSRLDENGNPLPQDIYDALHAGDEQNGGYNANVLMLLHVPGDGSRAASISIPRDDYVDLPGCPDGVCKGKIKQAYGYAFDQKARELIAQGVTDKTQREQQARDAGRKAQIDTVRQFLGGVPVDHFVEVTLVAFFQIAQVVQPITVCVNQDTQDSYSGANFHKGMQQIDAQQAVAFVRQRRDYVHPELNFTDLDRARRQQAFIISLAYQLKQGGAFANPAKLQQILDVAKQNTALDSRLDVLTFARQASSLTGGNVTFVTLPIDHFGKSPKGEDVNFVDLAQIRGIVAQLIGTPPPTSTVAVPTAKVSIVNSTSRNGLAAQTQQFLAGKGFTITSVGTDNRHRLATSTIFYGRDAADAANALSGALGGGIAVKADSEIAAGHVQLVIGADFKLPAAGGGGQPGGGTTSPTTVTTTPPGSGGDDPGLGGISGGQIPCVK
ncbi:LCP family protein [Amycolatopsis taiwanensis]|uniref:Transcriptional regulator n=1 Tax=Amycolatopsis taiwanensis TaxID=342230 RepID=A0A9W6R146_9PSEU|nr:LCP family protein [Amycolatopsis taiwanensis]GLY66448.1 transcriptional regulator [Amycolatopsis taiwanensis]